MKWLILVGFFILSLYLIFSNWIASLNIKRTNDSFKWCIAYKSSYFLMRQVRKISKLSIPCLFPSTAKIRINFISQELTWWINKAEHVFHSKYSNLKIRAATDKNSLFRIDFHICAIFSIPIILEILSNYYCYYL